MELLAISTFNVISGGLGILLVAFGYVRWKQGARARAALEDGLEGNANNDQ